MTLEKNKMKLFREAANFSIPMGGFWSCCCSYRFETTELVMNKQLMAHDVSKDEIQKKIDLLNEFMASPTSEMNKPSHGGW